MQCVHSSDVSKSNNSSSSKIFEEVSLIVSAELLVVIAVAPPVVALVSLLKTGCPSSISHSLAKHLNDDPFYRVSIFRLPDFETT